MATNHALTTASSITCGHSPPAPPPPAPPPPPSTGTLVIPPPTPALLTVAGKPVLALLPDTLTTASVAACPLPPPPAATTPCLKPTALTGTATRLTVGGFPVLLAEVLAPVLTGGPPPAAPAANAGQTLLRAE